MDTKTRQGRSLVDLQGWPDLLALHHLDPVRYPCLLESVGGDSARARYDILLVSTGEHLTLRRPGVVEGGTGDSTDNFFAGLNRWWQANRRPVEPSARPPFSGGWFIYLSYELAGAIEPRLSGSESGSESGGLPLARAERCPVAVIRDHALNTAWLIGEEGYAEMIRAVERDLARVSGVPSDIGRIPLEALVEDAPERFLAGVTRIKRHIRDGDVFQVNLSRAWHGRLATGIPTSAIYRRLRATNPAPFAALAQLDDCAIISSSPERLVGVRGGAIETRPIAGTHPRGGDAGSDRELSQRLLSHPKERAEHIMLIDLERNDLGRLCVPGSVEVNELLVLESYAHVHHIVSNVRGRLAAGIAPGDIIRAVFPGGTITGCPKVRCMEIIRDVEASPRGAYTGALGYLDRDGSMDLNILIRTMVRKHDAVTLRAGAGIVADSEPARELEETRSKARGLLRVFES